MKINKIKIKDFKSIYGEQEFDFSEYDGLIKLSGIIGSGKTTIGEALLWGLLGKVKDHKNVNLIAWHKKNCEIEIDLVSKNKSINIKRNTHAPLEVTIDGKLLSASNKRDTQEILEEEFFDVPPLAIQKMCIISFNAFNNSLASMTPGETRQFLDDIFGFKTFTEFNDEIVNERKLQVNENNQLIAVYNETKTQIENLNKKKEEQKLQLSTSINIDSLNKTRDDLINKGIKLKEDKDNLIKEFNESIKNINDTKLSFYNKKMEYGTLGKQVKEWVKKFGDGICPTCGHKIGETDVEEQKKKLKEYAKLYIEEEKKETQEQVKIDKIKSDKEIKIKEYEEKISDIKKQIAEIDSNIKVYNSNIKLISENYDDIITEYEIKLTDLENRISESDKDIGQWNDMNELFSKTLRYNLLDTLIPHINQSIKYYMDKLEQEYTVKYDQEFKPHIFIENNDNEISYKDLSTGQRKTLDIAIIFGVIQNVIANVDFNIFFLDELFSNMDSDSRNTMLNLLKTTLSENRTIFVVNHAEMPDDYFNHKIRVKLENKKTNDVKKKEIVLVKSSKYEKIF